MGKTALTIAPGQVVTQNNNCNIMLTKNLKKKSKSKSSAKAIYSLRLQKCSCCTTVLLFDVDDMYSVQDSY